LEQQGEYHLKPVLWSQFKMANNATLIGQLNANDLVTNSFFFTAVVGNTRLDEYIITRDQAVGDNLKLTLDVTTPTFDGVVVLVNAKTGAQLAIQNVSVAGGDEVINFALPAGDTSFKVIVTSSAALALPESYNLTAQVNNGNVELTSLNTAVSQASQTGTNPIVSGQLTDNDFISPSTPEYSLADEYRVIPTLAGNLTVGITGTPLGFVPRLEFINATTGTLLVINTGVAASIAGAALAVGQDYRVRVLANTAFGTNNVGSYQLAFNAPSGITVTPLSASQGAGVVSVNSPTLSPDPLFKAPDSTQYLRFNKGENGPVGQLDPAKPLNDFNLIALSTGDDAINLNIPPNPPFTDLQPAVKPDGTTDFANARWALALDGNDQFIGTANNDVPIAGNTGNDTFLMGSGADVAIGGKGSDKLNGENGNDILNGNLDNDRVDGGAGNDTLNGGQGEDLLFGQAGNDVLNGDTGRDFLTGGLDADVFVLTNNVDNIVATAAQADVITDFSIAQADKIQLVGAGFSDLTFESINLIVDGGAAVAATAIKLTTGGQYMGVVSGISPFDLANSSLFV
jgi:Ca2+-binding RTX toxin-like protein